METLQKRELQKEGFRVVVSRVLDTDPDTSYLGEYSSTLKPGGIDRQERGDQGRNEYRYFNPGCGYPEYIEQDYKRMEALQRQEWHYLGIVAKVYRAGIELGQASVWGFESDSGEEFFTEQENEIAGEAIETAKQNLAALCAEGKESK